MRGMVPTLGFSCCTEYYDRLPRTAGTSKYPLGKMLVLAVEGITSFSVKPLRLISLIGLIFVLVAVCVCVRALVIFLELRTVQGWTSIIISIWFVGGVLLFALGITGEYVSKIYTEVKRHPHYLEQERTGTNW